MNTVLNGVDVMERSQFAQVAGRRVGLVTNHTGRTRDGRSTADLLHGAPGVELAALFSPEHGIRGLRDEAVDDDVDPATGLPVYSLYGARTRPAAEQCAGIDVFVYDIQDIGCRFYTYVSTLGHILEAAEEFGKAVLVLDRPNPIGGKVSGPNPDVGRLSFTAYHSIPVRHGLTVGELGRLIHLERGLSCPLEVVPVKGWLRGLWFDETGLPWVNPSPNMRSLYAALLYPGIGLLEFTNISVGRGTDRPFEVIGAPYIDGLRLAEHLNACGTDGVRAMAVNFTPNSSVFSGVSCSGVMFTITDREAFDPIRLGLETARILIRDYSEGYSIEKLDTLLVNSKVKEALIADREIDYIRGLYGGSETEFRGRSERVLLYD